MSVRKRLHSLERKANAADELARPVTFIEMAHGIKDKEWRKGKNRRTLEYAHVRLMACTERISKAHKQATSEALKTLLGKRQITLP